MRARLATRDGRLEALALLAILVLAALTRLPGIDARGQWDADQGTDMIVLAGLVNDGTIPLLGPRTSIGTFHHGAVYYYLLAPSAFLSGADPVAVTVEIALFGIAAVAGIWWLARLLGGPVAAAAAGLLAAVSPAGISESTFIWNPNLIPAAAALAYGAAVMARRTGRARWWVAAGLGAMVTMQCHVLGVVIAAPLLAWWLLDLAARRRGGGSGRGTLLGGVGAVAVIALGYVPLLVNELEGGFAETRAILDYVAGDGGEAASGLVDRVLMVGLRSLTWPLVGLVTDRVAVSMGAALIAVVLVAVAVLADRRRPDPGAGVEPPTTVAASPAGPGAARWLLATFLFAVLALAMFAPSLAVVVPELPNDHYHSFLDPIVLGLAGVGLARLAGAVGRSRAPGPTPATTQAGPVAGRLVAGALGAVLGVMAVTAWPPAVSPDGGWPLADAAAVRTLRLTGPDPFALVGLPVIKNANAMAFPLDARGGTILPATARDSARTLVIVCDPLFVEALGAACGGPAEDAWLAEAGRSDLGLLERFEAGPRRVISVYSTTADLATTP